LGISDILYFVKMGKKAPSSKGGNSKKGDDKSKSGMDSPRLSGAKSPGLDSEEGKGSRSPSRGDNSDEDIEWKLAQNDKARSRHVRDEKDDAMDSLRAINGRLKRRLRDINSVVEKTLEKKQRNEAKMMWVKNRRSIDPEHTKRVRE